MKEKRKFKRVYPDNNKPIEAQIIGLDFIDVILIENISEGGIKIKIPHLFKGCDLQAPVNLIIKLPSLKSFKAQGFIKHIITGKPDDNHFGVQFTQLASVHQIQIRDYVSRRLLSGAES